MSGNRAGVTEAIEVGLAAVATVTVVAAMAVVAAMEDEELTRELVKYDLGPHASSPSRCFDCGARKTYQMSWDLDHWECSICGGKMPTPSQDGSLAVLNTIEWIKFMRTWEAELRGHDGQEMGNS